MKHIKEYHQFLLERKTQPIKGTPFKVYYGGREVEGSLKWVIDSDNGDLLNAYLEDEDQLWHSKGEAEDAVKGWWKKNKELYEKSGDLFNPKRGVPKVIKPINDKDLEREFFDLITTAYSEIGGHVKIKNPSDVFEDPEWNFWEGIDIHGDNDFDIIMWGKNTKYGIKYSGVGHDGTSDAKKTYLDERGKDLKKLGRYIEVSDKLAEILINKYKVPIVDSQEEVEKALGKPVNWIGKKAGASGTGWYSRVLGGKAHDKIMLGRPKI